MASWFLYFPWFTPVLAPMQLSHWERSVVGKKVQGIPRL